MTSVKIQKPAQSTPASATTATPPPPQQQVNDVTNAMNTLKNVLSAEMVSSTNAVYGFSITDACPSEWYVDLKTAPNGSLGSGPYNGKIDCTLTMNTEIFNKVMSGNLKPSAAFMTGKLKIKGNMGLAMKLEKLMGSFKSKL